MTQTQPVTHSTIKRSLQKYSVILFISILFTAGLGVVAVRFGNSTFKSYEDGLVQARHSVLVYESSFNKLPGANGNVAQLNSNDVVGFPARYSDYIKYVGTPSAKNFCLTLDLNAMLPSSKGGLLYIKSSSETIYNTKPSGC